MKLPQCDALVGKDALDLPVIRIEIQVHKDPILENTIKDHIAS